MKRKNKGEDMKREIIEYGLGAFLLVMAVGSFVASLDKCLGGFTGYPASSAIGSIYLVVGLFFIFDSISTRLKGIAQQLKDSQSSLESSKEKKDSD